MDYESANTESISLVILAAEALRKWKWLIVAVLIGAVLLGGYKFVGSSRPVQVDEALVQSMDANEKEAESAQKRIAIYRDKIAAYQEILVQQRQSWEKISNMLDTLETALAQVRQDIEDPNSSADRRAAAEERLPALAKDVLDVTAWLDSNVRQTRATQDEIVAWEQEIVALEDRLDTLQKEMAKLQAQVEAALVAGGIKSVVVFVLVGGILGAAVFCGVVVIQYLIYQKLRNARELEEEYQLPVLGQFLSESAKKHGKFDRILDRLVGDVQTLPEEEKVYELIAAGLLAAEPAPVHLAVTGTVKEEVLGEVCSQLKARLPEGTDVIAANNPVYSAQSLAELKQYQFLLVEQKGISHKQEIKRLVQSLRFYEAKIVGAVVK